MQHIMKLKPSPFEMIKSGQKTIELRLYDEKRKLVKVGNKVTFVKIDGNDEIINTKVIAIHLFNSFEELYEKLPLLKCGYTEENVSYAKHTDMEKYYSKEKQKDYGVVGIEIKLL